MAAADTPPHSMPKPRRPFSLLLLFLPTSLLALSLLLFLLACNNLSLLCFSEEPTFLHPSNPIPQSSSVLEVKEETQVPKPKSSQSLNLSNNSTKGHPQPSSSLPSRAPKWSRRTKSLLKLLQPNAQSKRFSVRDTEFFNGHSPFAINSSCKPRFFMTWISPSQLFGQRELFAVESLFKSHPNACLLIVSNTMDSVQGARLLRPFSKRGFRVAAMSPDIAYLFKNTLAEVWFERLRKGEVEPGGVSLGQNLSNLLRLAILYKYGGIYIDTDVIVIKSFLGLKNAIGAQAMDAGTGNWSRLNNAVMVFDKKHPLLYKFIEEFALTFNGSRWGHNGPYLVSRVVSRVTGSPGFEFTVLPPPAFYPVDWSRIRGLFRRPRGESHSKWVLGKLRWIQKESFALHLWNRQSRRMEVEEGSVIGRIMSDCCLFCNSSVPAT